jgi:hypothetical protein
MVAEMKSGFMAVLGLAAGMACTRIHAQTQSSGGGAPPAQNQTEQKQPSAPAPSVPKSQQNGNPFPGSTTNVPILPSGPDANVPAGAYAPANRAALPTVDHDPMRSPDSSEPDNGGTQGFSSSLTGVDDLLPTPDTTQPGKKGEPSAELPKETPENDISVGDYYLSVKNWQAALSRFQSALVLDPDSPDVYWGLAESERRLGDFALAREHYLKVLEYDPGSRHAKEAAKALREPAIANAKASPAAPAGTAKPQTQ